MNQRLSFLLLVLVPCHAWATNYYVSTSGNDRNAGTLTAPFATIQAAADRVQPGDVVNVPNGTYGVVTINRSGTAVAPIVFQAMPGQHPIIDSSGKWGGITINGAAYITVQGFEVVGDAKSVTLSDAQSQRNNTHNPVTGGDGIDIQKDGNTFSHHIIIKNCVIHDEPGGGIVAMNADYVSIIDNVTYGNAYWSPYGGSGISMGYSTSFDAAAGYHNHIVGNVAHDNQEFIPFHVEGKITDGNGIIIDSNNSNGYTGRTLVANNIVYKNGGTGIHTFKSDHVDLVHNTAFLNNVTSSLDEGQIVGQLSNDVKIENNIMVAASGRLVNGSTSGYSVTYDYNVYFGGSVSTMGDHDVIGDPMFVSPDTGNFALCSGSTAIGTANSAFAIGTGNQESPRPSGAGSDRGALLSTASPCRRQRG